MSAFELPVAVPAVLLILFLGGWFLVLRHLRALRALPEEAPATDATVCVCIPARNEAGEVGRAVDAWLAQDLSGMRLVVVDDGSTDGTSEELALRQAPGRLEVLRNDHLPPGWLGKNHALHLATSRPWAQAAEWLVFADADVRTTPDLLRRAVHLARQTGASALTLVPAVETVTFWERLMLPFGSTGFLALISPAGVEGPNPRMFCGIGAFMLVRRDAYEAVGGHAAAPLEAVDDMMLARRIKASGRRNVVARGGPDLRLRMYRGAADLVRGMRKNVLAMPGFFPLAPVLVALALAITWSPLWLALGGWPGAGLLAWLIPPAIAGEVHQRVVRRPLDPLMALWPLMALPLVLATAWAFLDRLRGTNVWRGRRVKLT